MRFILRSTDIFSRCIKTMQEYLKSGLLYEVIIREYDEKSRAQEEKYHAMISDISKQLLHNGEKLDAESWKRLLIEAFVIVMQEIAKGENKPDPFHGKARLIMSLDGKRIVQLGVQSRSFGKKVASDFIEYLYAYGVDNGVKFSAKALQ